MKVALLLAMAATLAFAGCGKKEAEPTVQEVPAEEPETPAEEPEETKEPTEEDQEEESIEGKVRSALTNEWIDEELAEKRPISVMFNNIKEAVPQTSISRAGVVYESPVEGNLTRLMGIIEDWEDLEKIGSVRSCRDYFVYWSLEWDAIYCHFGGPALYVTDVLSRDDVNNLDGTSLDGSVYYRTKDRKAPHNAYASGEGILKGISKFGYERNHTDRYQTPHYQFAKANEPEMLEDGISAKKVEPGYPINKPWFEYNEEDGLYYRFQYGGKHIDDMNGEQLAYKNIILQNTKHEVRDAKGYLLFHFNDNTKSGYYITNGKAIEVTWQKTNDLEPTRYYDKDGNEIKLNEGKTWVCIIQEENKDKVVIE